MAKKRIMSIGDLYNFCLKNNFSHFASNDECDEIVVQMFSSFETQTSDDKYKEGFTPFVSKAYHDHINLNKSEITTETLEDTLPSAMLRPVLANILVDEETGVKDFGSHDYTIEEDEDGNEVIRYYEQPVGVVFGNNSIEYDKEADVNRVVLHGYLWNGYCQDAIDIINRRKEVSCSVELSIREMSFNAKDKVLTLEDFYVSGLTLLGEKVKPGMAGSNVKLEDFNLNADEKYRQFNCEENTKLIEMLEKLSLKIDELSNFAINNSNRKEDGVLVNDNDNVTITTDPVVTNMPNVTEPVAAMFDGDNVVNNNNNTVVDDINVPDVVVASAATEPVVIKEMTREEAFDKFFELSHDDIRYALNALISVYRNEKEWCYVNKVYDDYFIMEDWDNDKYYKQSYERDGDNVSLSGERIELFLMLLTESEKIEVEEMRTNYSLVCDKLDKYEKDELNAKKNAILDAEEYSVLAENAEFIELRKNMENYSLDELSKEADLIFAKHIKSTKHFSLDHEDNTPKKNSGVFFSSSNNTDNDVRKPYGGIFDNFKERKNNK